MRHWLIFERVILWFLFAVFNYYAVQWSFRAMSYSNDLVFLGGLGGVILLVTIDAMILFHVFKRYLPKGDSQ